MKFSHLKYAIKRSAQLALGDDDIDNLEIIVLGSQAIHGTQKNPPSETLTMSREVDVYIPDNPKITNEIDRALGEGSRFHAECGYYVQGVGERTAKLPKGWSDRTKDKTVRLSGHTFKARFLEAHDLAVSKMIAGRTKDELYLEELLEQDLVDSDTLRERLSHVPNETENENHGITEEARFVARDMLNRLTSSGDDEAEDELNDDMGL